MNIGVAFSFRYSPEREGRLKPLSLEQPWVKGRDSRFNGKQVPILGYACIFDGAAFSWDGVWFQPPVIRFDGKPNRNASLRTDRTCLCDCPDCGEQPFPAWAVGGKEATEGATQPCPLCGEAATIHEAKPGSDAFMRLVGDLEGPLKQAAQDAFSSGVPFLFPGIFYARRKGQITVRYKKTCLGLERIVVENPVTRQDALSSLMRADPTQDSGQARAARLGALLDEAAANGRAEIAGTGVSVEATPESDPSLPREVVLSALWQGHVLKSLTSSTLDELREIRDISYHADPAIASGVVDDGDAKAGISLGGGAIDEQLKIVQSCCRQGVLVGRY